MKKRVLYSLLLGAVVLLSHYVYGLYSYHLIASLWKSIGQESYLTSYIGTQEVFLGLSYACSAGFLAYALMTYRDNRRAGVAGLAGSVTLSGALYVGACFFLGCCGSPMLGVYLALFGAPLLGLTKIATFVLTLVSVVLGVSWLERRLKASKACCQDETECKSGVC